MPTVFCDNYGCMFIDEDGFCDCDKLDIVGGECMGSVHGGRSVTESDTCEKLKTENAKLRELCEDMNKVAHMLCEAWEGSCSKEAEGMSLHAVCPIGDTSELCVFGKLHDRMRELRIEVDG